MKDLVQERRHPFGATLNPGQFQIEIQMATGHEPTPFIARLAGSRCGWLLEAEGLHG